MDLQTYLNVNLECKNIVWEGATHDLPEQGRDLVRYASRPEIIRIMEIGFNAGHSAELFLNAKRGIHLTSFDIGVHQYVAVGKQFIDKAFPDRHRLILGDSRNTIVQFCAEHPGATFDLIFVDGGHQYDCALADLRNCKLLAHPDTIVVMDDTVYNKGWEEDWTKGPSRAWIDMLESRQIYEIERKQYKPGRGQCVGKYLFGDAAAFN